MSTIVPRSRERTSPRPGRAAGGWLYACLGIGTLSAAAVAAAYRRDMAPLRRQVRSGSTMLHTRRGPIEVAVRGEGPAVLAVHGAGGGYDQGLLVAGNAFGEGCRIVAPSRFGYLRTPVPQDVSPAAQADAHAAVLDALGIERAVVMGVSAGAPSSIEFALRYPHRTAALILLVPAGYAPGHEVRLDPALSSQLVLRLITAGADFALWTAMKVARPLVVRFLGVPPEVDLGASPADRDHIDAVMRSILPISWRVPGVRIDSTTRHVPRPLERIEAPTLVVSAEDDLFGTLPAARHIADGVPGARLVVYATGGHLLVGHDAELQEIGRGFLREAQILPDSAQTPQPARHDAPPRPTRGVRPEPARRDFIRRHATT